MFHRQLVALISGEGDNLQDRAAHGGQENRGGGAT